jgi:hypothetical protein
MGRPGVRSCRNIVRRYGVVCAAGRKISALQVQRGLTHMRAPAFDPNVALEPVASLSAVFQWHAGSDQIACAARVALPCTGGPTSASSPSMVWKLRSRRQRPGWRAIISCRMRGRKAMLVHRFCVLKILFVLFSARWSVASQGQLGAVHQQLCAVHRRTRCPGRQVGGERPSLERVV